MLEKLYPNSEQLDLTEEEITEFKERLNAYLSNPDSLNNNFLSDYETKNIPVSKIRKMSDYYEAMYTKAQKEQRTEEDDIERNLYNIVIFLGQILSENSLNSSDED